VGVQFEHGLRIEYDRSSAILTISGSGKVAIDITGEVDIQASTKVQITAITEVDITAPLTKVTGALEVVGELTAGGFTVTTGLGGGSGKMTGDGDIETTGKITGAEVHEGLIRLGTHKHLGVTTGSGTSGTPTP
jgi:phage baseplate assembly protein gpV